MATALVLQADGRRIDGKWDGARGRGIIRPEVGTNQKTWQNLLHQCGIVLDYKPDLAPAVVAGDTTLNDAFTQADAIRTSAERDKIMARRLDRRHQVVAHLAQGVGAEDVEDEAALAQCLSHRCIVSGSFSTN